MRVRAIEGLESTLDLLDLPDRDERLSTLRADPRRDGVPADVVAVAVNAERGSATLHSPFALDSEVYLFTEGCMEVVQKESVVLDLEPGPPEVVRILLYGGEVECRVVKAMADGQVAGE